MNPTRFVPLLRTVSVLAGATVLVSSAHAQLGYGVDASGDLFRFGLGAPGAVTTIGNLGFVPEAIDFRPGTTDLFAIEVGPTGAQLYSIDVATATFTTIGSGFALAGSVGGLAYDLTGSTSFGFDFNPTTLQPDGSIRIRFVSDNGTDLRLHSATGLVAAVDGALAGTIGAVAYINSAQQLPAGNPTALYDVDFTSDSLFLQNPPNAGTLSLIGALGVDVGAMIGFDILTAPSSVDAGIGGDTAYLVDTLGAGSSVLYRVDLATGAATSLATLGVDFTGGFAVANAVPEPSTYGAIAAVALGALVWRRRQQRAAVVRG